MNFVLWFCVLIVHFNFKLCIWQLFSCKHVINPCLSFCMSLQCSLWVVRLKPYISWISRYSLDHSRVKLLQLQGISSPRFRTPGLAPRPFWGTKTRPLCYRSSEIKINGAAKDFFYSAGQMYLLKSMAFSGSHFPSPLRYNIRVMVIVWRLRENVIRTALCWIVWHNVHSQQHIYMSSSYRSNRLGLSHWNPYAVYSK